MERIGKSKLNIIITAFLFTLIMTVVTSGASAASVPAASGQINSYDGAILRERSTTNSAMITVLEDNTKLKIHKELFKSKTGTSASMRWYKVTANGMTGYVRADLVDNIKFKSVQGKTTDDVNYRKGAGIYMSPAGTFSKGKKLKVVLTANPVDSAKGSSKTWYKVRYGSKYYYVCSSYVKLVKNAVSEPKAAAPANDKYDRYLEDQGFPKKYRAKLTALHKAHPNWKFVAYKTNISWSKALAKQTSGGRSLVSGVFPSSYRDGSRQYEKGWYKASSKVVAYYMDPRNFLTESSIYMFEDLTYKPEYQTAEAVNEILRPSKLPACGFTANIFVKAAKANNVSPVFLASRARQETGNGGAAVNGTKVLGKKVYNPFNIGAFGGTNPLYNGLIYAYGKGWTTPAKAVRGGSLEIAKNYIHKGQYTGYYQRFNVRNGEGKVGTHQYMTNIMASYSEALSTKASYKKYGISSQPLVFEIPVYTGMPSSTKLP